MRTKLKLWQLVDKHFDEYFESGLCSVIFRLRVKAMIDFNEYLALFNELDYFGDTEGYFLGEEGDAKPRKEFIQKRIKAHGGFRQ